MIKLWQVIGLTALFAVTTIQTGCVTQQKCAERFPPKTHDSIVYKDSIVFKRDTIFIPAYEFTFDTSGVIPENITFHHTEKKKNLTASVSISKGKLTVTCKEDSLRAIIETQDRLITSYKGSTEVKIVKEFEKHWYDKPLLYGFNILLIIVFILLLYSRLTMFAKSLFNK